MLGRINVNFGQTGTQRGCPIQEGGNCIQPPCRELGRIRWPILLLSVLNSDQLWQQSFHVWHFFDSVQLLCNNGSIDYWRRTNPSIQWSNGWQNSRQPFETLAVPRSEGTTKTMMQSLGTGSALLCRCSCDARAFRIYACTRGCRTVHSRSSSDLCNSHRCQDAVSNSSFCSPSFLEHDWPLQERMRLSSASVQHLSRTSHVLIDRPFPSSTPSTSPSCWWG